MLNLSRKQDKIIKSQHAVYCFSAWEKLLSFRVSGKACSEVGGQR